MNLAGMSQSPSSIGEALMDRLGTYFNTAGLCTQINGRRNITFAPTPLLSLKSSAVSLPTTPLPLETGLATFFTAAKGG